VTWILVLAVVALVLAASAEFSALATRRIERTVPPQGQFLDLDGERLHYLDVGQGTPLVLIHGLSGQMGNFAHSLVGPLSAGFRVVAFDRPGSGYSTRAAGRSASLAAQAETLAKAIGVLNLDRPVVVGHSLGGAVALAIGLDHPASARGLVLVAPLTHPIVKLPPIFASLALPAPILRAFAWTLGPPILLLTRKWGVRQVFSPEPPPADFETLGGGLLGARPRNIAAAGDDVACASADLEAMVPRYPTLTMPVAVLYGRGDALLDWRAQGESMLAEVPGLDLEVMDGGHMLPVTAPDRIVAMIRRVAERAEARAPAPGLA